MAVFMTYLNFSPFGETIPSALEVPNFRRQFFREIALNIHRNSEVLLQRNFWHLGYIKGKFFVLHRKKARSAARPLTSPKLRGTNFRANTLIIFMIFELKNLWKILFIEKFLLLHVSLYVLFDNFMAVLFHTEATLVT